MSSAQHFNLSGGLAMSLLLASNAPSGGELVDIVVSIVSTGIGVTLVILRILAVPTDTYGTPAVAIPHQPDHVHKGLMTTDRDYRRRIHEAVVFMALAFLCLVAAGILKGVADAKLAVYVACCGVGMEWWATATTARLVITKFTETVQTLFIIAFSFAILLAVIVSIVISMRLSQITE